MSRRYPCRELASVGLLAALLAGCGAHPMEVLRARLQRQGIPYCLYASAATPFGTASELFASSGPIDCASLWKQR